MPDPIDQEVEAIRGVLSALSPLSEKARASVLDYVTKRLGLEMPEQGEHRTPSGVPLRPQADTPGAAGEAPVHIKTLKDEKKPRSANEMAALVGYYLSALAPADKRKRQ